MKYLRNKYFSILFVFSVVALAISGCAYQRINVQDLLNQPTEEVDHFKSCSKYKKAGITVVPEFCTETARSLTLMVFLLGGAVTFL